MIKVGTWSCAFQLEPAFRFEPHFQLEPDFHYDFETFFPQGTA